MKKNKLYSFTKTVSRVLQIILIVAAVLCVVCSAIVYFAMSDSLLELVKQQVLDGKISVSELGMSLEEFSKLGDVRTVGVLGCLYGFICTTLGSLIFGNIYKVFKNIENDMTPFTKENVRLIKNIGIYAIVSPFVGGVISIIMAIIFKSPNFKATIDVTTLFMGFVVLCLSQFFAHGVELEDEVNGLL